MTFCLQLLRYEYLKLVANELDKPITYAEVNKTSSKICGRIWIFMIMYYMKLGL